MSDERRCRRCKLPFTPHPRALRTRVCGPCSAIEKKERQQRRAEKRKRHGERGNPKARWQQQSLLGFCEYGGERLGKGEGLREHIIPRRLILMLKLEADPDDERNLASCCRKCHGPKTSAEQKLILGDVLGFCRAMIRLGLAIPKLRAALKLYGFHTENALPETR